MLSIGISDNGIMAVEASVRKKSISVDEFTRAENGCCKMDKNGFADYDHVVELLAKALHDVGADGRKDRKAYVTLDSSTIVLREIAVPIRSDRRYVDDAKKYLRDYRAHVSDYVVDYKLGCRFEDAEGNLYCNVTVAFVYAEIIRQVNELLADKSVNIKPIAIDIAQNSSVRITEALTGLDGRYILLDFKADFITMYLYANGVKEYTESYAMTNKLGSELYFNELYAKLRAVTDYADANEIQPQVLYVTGDIPKLGSSILQRLANNLEINVNQFPKPKTVTGMKVIQFNEYYAPVGALLRELK